MLGLSEEIERTIGVASTRKGSRIVFHSIRGRNRKDHRVASRGRSWLQNSYAYEIPNTGEAQALPRPRKVMREWGRSVVDILVALKAG